MMGGGGGPGLMGTMAASAVGSVAGNAIAHRMFGNSNEQQPQVQQQQPIAQPVQGIDPCKTQFEAYAKCMEASGSAQSCSWAWDMVSKCRMSNGSA